MNKVLVALVLLVAASLVTVAPAQTATTAPASAEKKRCRTVVKKVRGKRKRVRVCRRTRRPAPRPQPSTPPLTQPSARVAIQIGAEAGHVAAGLGSIWVAAGASIVRIDPATNAVVRIYPISGPACGRIAVGFGAVWTGQCGSDDHAYRVDVQTGAVTSIPGSRIVGFSLGSDGVWAVSLYSELLKLDGTTGTVLARYPVAGVSTAVGFGSVWVADNGAGTVSRVEPVGGTVAASMPVGNGYSASTFGPEFLVTGGGAVWTANSTDRVLYRIDPATNTAAPVRGVSLTSEAIDFALDSVWVRNGDLVFRIDPVTQRVVARYRAPGGLLAGGFGSVWIASGQSVVRLTP